MSALQALDGDRAVSESLGVRVGKDVLELVSTAMYVDPLTLYREYVQNAADAIDAARAEGALDAAEPGTVEIVLDPAPAIRSIRIRDNGTGLGADRFLSTLLALGGSAKRGRAARGFRGVGRFAGLGYARELIFRSRIEGEDTVSELVWDGMALRAALRDPSCVSLDDLVARAARQGRVAGEAFPARFFEVEMRGVVRQGADRLLSASAVHDYLSQIAPLPFSPEFTAGATLQAALAERGVTRGLDLQIAGLGPVYRPHRDRLELPDGRTIVFGEPRILDLPAHDDGVAAVVWVLDHEYEGALPAATLVKGLRARVGDLQIGEGALFEELFAEPRFNAWTVGEVHVLDPRILPNGRRDQFEPNVHSANLLNQLGPVAKAVSQACRTRSTRRKWLRDAETHQKVAAEKLEVVGQGALGAAVAARTLEEIDGLIARVDKIATVKVLEPQDSEAVKAMAAALRHRRAETTEIPPLDRLDRLPPEDRAYYTRFFDLIYECSVNRVAAKALIDRILDRLTDPGAAGQPVPAVPAP